MIHLLNIINYKFKMITHSFSKEENNQNKSSMLGVFDVFKLKMNLFSYYSGEKVLVGKFLALVCIYMSYLKVIGDLLFGINFNGFTNGISNDIIKVINFTHLIANEREVGIICLILLFLKNLIYLASFIMTIYKISAKQHSNPLIIKMISICHCIGILNFWIIFSFELEMSLFVLLNPDYSADLKLFLNIVSISNLLISTVISLIYCFYSNKSEINFQDADFLSRIDKRFEYVFFILKFLFSINFTVIFKIIDISAVDKTTYNIYNAINFLLAIILILTCHINSFYYYSIINISFTYLNLCVLYTTCIVFFILNYNESTEKDFILLVGYLTFFPISKLSTESFWERFISKIPFVEIKDNFKLCQYMATLTYIVCEEERIKESSQLQLIGVIKQHELNCVYERCVCKKPEGYVLYIPKSKSYYVKSQEQFGYKNSKIYFLHLIKNIYEFLLVVTRGQNTNLILMFAYFIFQYMGNYYLSLELLINLKKNKNLTFQQQISLNRSLEKIYHQIENINSDKVKSKVSNNSLKIDFDSIIYFYEKISILKDSINLAVDSSISFWNSIANKSEIAIIKENGLNFHSHHKIIEETFNEIIKIYSGLFDINSYYQLYKKYVFGDIYNSESIQILNNTKGIKFDMFDNIMDKEKVFNSKSTIIIANLVDKNKATIEKISENIKSFLGYKPSECLGQDVKLLMPNFFKLRHSSFLTSHYESGVNKIINQEHESFALHAEGYSLPVSIIVKMLPSRGETIQYASFIREITLDYDFILTNDQGRIEMLSKNVVKNLKLNTNLINSIDYYYIHFICKEYFNEIMLLTQDDYQISSLLTKSRDVFGKEDKKEYKYQLLHLKSDSFIDMTLKEFKKNESSANSSSKNSPLIKIISQKDTIKANFKTEKSEVVYSIIENIYPCQNETLKVFKLYNSINHDNTVNMDEIQIIERFVKNDKWFNHVKKTKSISEDSYDSENYQSDENFDINSSEDNKKTTSKYSSDNNSSINSNLRKKAKNMQKKINRNSSSSGSYSNSEKDESEEGEDNIGIDNKNNNFSNKMSKLTSNNMFNKNKKNNNNNNQLTDLPENKLLDYEFITNQPLSTDGNSHKISLKNKKMKEYDFLEKAFVKEEEENDFKNKEIQEFTEKTGSSQTSLSSRTEAEYFKQYLSIKKRYENKKIYQEFRLIIFTDLFLLFTIVVLLCYNYVVNFQKVLDIFKSINDEFFPLISSVKIMCTLLKNSNTILYDNAGYVDLNTYNSNSSVKYQPIASSLDDFSNGYYNRFDDVYIYSLDYYYGNYTNNYDSLIFSDKFYNLAYKDVLFDYFQMTMDQYYSTLKILYSANLTFSPELQNLLFEKISLSVSNFDNYETTIFDTYQLMYMSLGQINKITLINSNNDNLELFLTNIKEKYFIANLGNAFIESLTYTQISIDDYLKLKHLFLWILIVLILLISVLIYFSIIIYYRKQYELISLLLGIDEETSSAVLESIKFLSSFLRQKNTLERVNTNNNSNNKNNNNNDDIEKEALIENDNTNQNKNKNKKNKQNHLNYNQFSGFYTQNMSSGKNEINWKIYFDVLFKIIIIIGLTLIPFIILISNRSLEKKSTSFIDLIKNTKTNDHLMMISFTIFQDLVKSKNQTEIDIYYGQMKNLMNTFRENQFNTSSLIYDTVSDLSDSNAFKHFYTIQFCPDEKTTLDNGVIINNPYYKYIYDCQRSNSPYEGEGYSYISNINTNLIDDLLRNSIILSSEKTDSDIKTIYENSNYILAEKTFDILTTYGIDTYNSYVIDNINSYVSSFENQYIALFIFCFLLLLFNQITSILFVRHIIRVVNYELKNIFSLMPYIIVMGNANIYEMLRK